MKCCWFGKRYEAFDVNDKSRHLILTKGSIVYRQDSTVVFVFIHKKQKMVLAYNFQPTISERQKPRNTIIYYLRFHFKFGFFFIQKTLVKIDSFLQIKSVGFFSV